jgi:dephospho-CoA kinase
MKPFCLGLTGSIGMGKSTTAAMFADAGIPVWDADTAVHRLYAAGGAAVAAIAALCPAALIAGAIDRTQLKAWIASDPTALAQIESVVHPLVAADRAAFVADAAADLVVLDIPLLFENGTQAQLDATLLVTAPPALQRARVLARPGMTPAQFALLLSRQMPDAQKRGLATHIVETLSEASVRAYVTALIAHLKGSHA